MEFQELIVSGDINRAKSLTAAPFMKHWEEYEERKDRLGIWCVPFDSTVVDIRQLNNTADLRDEGTVHRVQYPSGDGRTISASVDRCIAGKGDGNDPRNRPGAVVSESKIRRNVKLYREEDGWKVLAITWNTWDRPVEQISIEKPVLVPTLE